MAEDGYQLDKALYMDPISIVAIGAALASLGALLKPLFDVFTKYLHRASRTKVRISVTDRNGKERSLEYGGPEDEVSEEQLKKLITLLEEASDGDNTSSSSKK